MSRVSLPFPSTDWSAIARTSLGSEGERREALSALVARYMPVLRAYLRFKWRLSSAAADDILQNFLLDKVLEQDLLGRADRSRGRFRTLLMTALDRYVISEHRRKTSDKELALEGVSLEAADEAVLPGPRAADTFDIAWARQVLGIALERMRAECDATSRPEVWGLFESRVLGPTLDGIEPPPLRELVSRHRLASAEQASNLLITAKRMFARHLRLVIAEYVPPEDVEEEIRVLMQILSRACA
jgi:DNA-directed RNA polymerase specialized sigma24 family protein